MNLLKSEVVKKLLDLGIPPNIKGFHYLTVAICNWKPGISLKTELYPLLGSIKNKAAIERNMMYAISQIRINTDHKMFNDLENMRYGPNKVISISKFISYMSLNI